MAESTENNQEIELTLGLSLNGRFGVDPKSSKNQGLIRSASSVSNLLEISSSNSNPLTRTCSLPVEAEEETRKRKEMQMLRRMEAKRKRSEKQRRDNGGEKLPGSEKLEFWGNGFSKVGVSGQGFESKHGLVGSGVDSVNVVGGLPPPPHLSQGSSASSSGTSEFDSQSPPPSSGIIKSAEVKSPQSVQSFSDQNEPRMVLWSGDPKKLRKTALEDGMVKTQLNPSRSMSETSRSMSNDVIRNILADMPCVSTKVDGPNGKRVEGFLYRYRKGEELRIVCVCHGSFLTPAEFIKHAGGGEVKYPLRHIVVNPTPFL